MTNKSNLSKEKDMGLFTPTRKLYEDRAMELSKNIIIYYAPYIILILIFILMYHIYISEVSNLPGIFNTIWYIVENIMNSLTRMFGFNKKLVILIVGGCVILPRIMDEWMRNYQNTSVT